MNSYNFIADMNGLQQEFASLPPEVRQMICSLLEMVEEQERLIKTMLDVNKRLIDKR